MMDRSPSESPSGPNPDGEGTMPSLKALEKMSLTVSKRAWRNDAAWHEAKELDDEMKLRINEMKNERILIELKRKRIT